MDEFIEKIIIRRTIQAAFQRGKVYANNISKKDQIRLKESLRDELKKITKKYANSIPEDNHVRNIEQLSQKYLINTAKY